MEHFPDCVAAFEEYRKKKRAFEFEFPMYCRKCGGHGGRVVRYDPSPRGVSLAPGYMEEFDECPDCFAKGICPRCGTKLIEESEKYVDWYRCPKCEWTDKVGDVAGQTLASGLPEEPECCCDERRTFEKDLRDEPV